MSGSVRVLVQARMSSRRFPGKVLAPFRGRPVIRHVLDAVRRALPSAGPMVLTSGESSDDPLAAYLRTQDIPVFRGPLDDVFDRYRRCVALHPCDWFLRLCADSPLLSPSVIRAVTDPARRAGVDLVTTVFPRTFPRGQNAEIVRVAAFLSIDPGALTAGDREHVTAYYYRHPDRFRILNVASGDPPGARPDLVVDTAQDLLRMEGMSDAEIEALRDAPYSGITT